MHMDKDKNIEREIDTHAQTHTTRTHTKRTSHLVKVASDRQCNSALVLAQGA